jgi:dolichyl-phosphate beta-glucosyltransferase
VTGFDLSIVIPAYNEEERIGDTLDELAALVADRGWNVEVVVVDDGSTDRTISVAESHLEAFAASRVIPSQPNRGKGYAVRTGMLTTSAPLRVFMDADGSTDLGEVDQFLQHSRRLQGEHILVGSVAMDDSDVTPQPLYRQVAGRMANWLIQVLVLPGIKDSQRGFKLFTAAAAEEVFGRCDIDGWLFDVEALAIAKRLGYPIVELPIKWEHREASRVSLRSYLQTLLDLLRVRWRLWRNYYHLGK